MRELIAGQRRFYALAVAIGDWRTVNRIEAGLHPFREERIRTEHWIE